MRIVHIGDIHVYQRLPAPHHLLGKRLLGQLNLWLRRMHHFNLKLLPELVDRVHREKPDLILFSGDLTTTALNAEFEQAHKALRPLMEDYTCLIVPGNHDRYTFTAARTRRLEHHFPVYTPGRYPYHHPLGEKLHLIALDPTRANILTARGRLGEPQLQKLKTILAEIEPDARLIVLCHYTIGTPPGTPTEKPHHAMTDASALVDLLRGERPTLYLHGHVHRPWQFLVPGAQNITAINAGAPLMCTPHHPRGQGFAVVEIADDVWTSRRVSL